ncbi:MAG: hypothetical protein ACPGDB_04615, partial [Fusobacterium sp.]
MEKKSQNINEEKEIKTEKLLKMDNLNKFLGVIFFITLITGYFYFNRDYTPKKILIRNNEIEKEGAKSFIRLLRSNMSLLNVDLRNNPCFSDDMNS